jgi:signal transduction histidine kinase
MFRSLRGRLMVLLVLLLAAAIAAGILMFDLFRQSTTAQAGQAAAEIGRACDAIAAAYSFYSAGWQGPAAELGDEALSRALIPVVYTALRDRPGVEGGIWQSEAGSLAYAYPTYDGGGPKTDVPQAELPRIRAVNRAAMAEEHQVSSRYDAASQVLLMTACPLPGPIRGVTGWAMSRVYAFAGQSYRQLMAGLAILLISVVTATVLLSRLTIKWSRHVSQTEGALKAHDIADLPALPTTGERELDRIVTALNEAGQRLAAARQRADRLANQLAVGERLAAIGRMAAGLAHEIRNPIAAMRLRAENAIAGDADRKRQSLLVILEQIERLETLLRRLLSVTERDEPREELVALGPFLDHCAAAQAELAGAKRITLECHADEASVRFDPIQMQSAVDSLILNAIAAAPADSRILITARRRSTDLVLAIHDDGMGPPASIRDRLFEPFVTGRADGTGLGLSIVREVAAANGGIARLADSTPGTTFEIVLPWRPS